MKTFMALVLAFGFILLDPLGIYPWITKQKKINQTTELVEKEAIKVLRLNKPPSEFNSDAWTTI